MNKHYVQNGSPGSVPAPARRKIRSSVTGLMLMVAMLLSVHTIRAQAPTITYTSADGLTKGYGSSALVVKVVFNGPCTGARVRIGHPPGVSYVTGTVSKVSGTPALGIAYDAGSSTPQSPVFDITGTITTGSEIEFTLNRKADCAAAAGGGFDSVYVTFTGSCTNSAMINPDDLNARNYQVYSPALSITPDPAPVTNAVIGTAVTRTHTITNGGNGATDTVRFYIVYPGGAVVNTAAANAITANGTSFTPSSTSGDTLFYKIAGPALFGGDARLDNSETVTITEPVRVTACGTPANATVLGAGWGRDPANACHWSNASSAVTMANGAANVQVRRHRLVQPTNFCQSAIYEVVLYNGGTETVAGAGTAFDIIQQFGFNYGESSNPVRAQLVLKDIEILNGPGSWQPLTYTAGSASAPAVVDFSNAANYGFSSSGLTDANGNGRYNDLKVGDSVTLRFKVDYTCAPGCNATNKSGAPYYKTSYTNMCGTSPVTPLMAGSSATNPGGLAGNAAQGEIINRNLVGMPIVSGPTDIADGETAIIKLTGSRDFSTNIVNSATVCATNHIVLRIAVPKGFGIGAGSGFFTGPGNAAGAALVSATLITGVTMDTLVFVGQKTNGNYREGFHFEAPLALSCAGYVPGAAPITYTIDYICDAGCGCAEQWYCGNIPLTPHCGTCTEGGLTITRANLSRTTGGYTSATSGTFVDVSALTEAQLKYMMPGDTVQGTFTGKMINGTAAPFTAHHFRMSYTAPGSAVVLQLAGTAVYEIWRGGLPAGGSTVMAASVNTVASGIHTMEYDLSAFALQPGDSVIIKPRFVVQDNGSLATAPAPLSNLRMIYFSKNVANPAAEYNCDSYSAEAYPYRSVPALSSGTQDISNTGCNTYTITTTVSSTGASFDVYPGELRNAVLLDSIKIEILNGDFFAPSGTSLSAFGQTASEGLPVNNFDLMPYAATSPNGKTRVFVNDGTWPKSEAQNSNVSYNISTRLINGCSSLPTGHVRLSYYMRRNGHAQDGSFTVVTTPSGSQNFNKPVHNTMPSVNITALNSPVQGTSTLQYWDIRLANTTNINAPNAWFALETAGTGVVVDNVVTWPGNVPVPAEGTYGGGNAWYKASPNNIANATSTQMYRVYFRYNSCGPDSIQVKAGWNCSGYPASPLDFPCTAGSTYLNVVPEPSQVQLSVSRQPGGGSTVNLCSTDSVLLVINSAQAAHLNAVNLTFTPPVGVSIPAAIPVEYPLGSGLYENVPVTVAGRIYTINVSAHSGISANGMPGTAAAPASADRQAKVKVDFSTSCDFVSGNSFRFNAWAARPCGQPATGSGTEVNTDAVLITGATAPGSAGMTLDFGAATATGCGNAVTLSSTITPTSIGSSVTDTVVYTLPAGLVYAGNPSAGITPVISGSTVKIGMPVVAASTPVPFSFDVVAGGGGCGNASVTATYNRAIGGLTCGVTTCAASAVVIANGSSPAITLQKPSLGISNVVLTGGFFRPGQSYTAAVSISNSSSTAAPAATYIVEAFCGSSSIPFDAQVFAPAVAASGMATGTMAFSVPAVVCHTGDQVTYRIRPLTATGTQQCLCSEASYLSSEALPVKLISFNAYKKGHTALLQWATATEQDNKGFEVQHSADGSSWSNIGFVRSKAAGGNSSSRQDYTFTHGKPVDGTNLYRLKQSDLNGRHEYSPVRMVSFGKDEGITIYPNPVTDMVRVEGLSGESRIRVYDVTGRLVAEQRADSSAVEISLIHLGEGVYHIHILGTDGTLTTRKIVKAR